jgi:hypothetical protein
MNNNGIDVFISHDDLMEISPEYRLVHNKDTIDICDFYKQSMGLLSYTYLLYKLCQQSCLDDNGNGLKKIQEDKNDIMKKVHKQIPLHSTNE